MADCYADMSPKNGDPEKGQEYDVNEDDGEIDSKNH